MQKNLEVNELCATDEIELLQCPVTIIADLVQADDGFLARIVEVDELEQADIPSNKILLYFLRSGDGTVHRTPGLLLHRAILHGGHLYNVASLHAPVVPLLSCNCALLCLMRVSASLILPWFRLKSEEHGQFYSGVVTGYSCLV